MRILFSSTRGSGHLQPLIPYARALLQHGHEVLVAGPGELGDPLRDAGLAHAPFDHPGDAALGPIWARLAGLTGDAANAVAAGEIFAGVNSSVALPKLQETVRAWKPDVIVRDSVEFASAVAAEFAGVPHAVVQVHMGCVEEKLFAHVIAPVDALRRTVGLAPDNGASLRAERVFTAFPASLDTPGPEAQLGAPFRVRMPEDQPPSATRPLWAPSDGKTPLVYITFGTIVGSTPRLRGVYRTALDAVAELPVRALLTTGRGMEPGVLGAIPANVHVEAWVPQRDVLPHVAALVCHGGSGTVLGALAAGLPMVVLPQGADQPDNAKSIAAARAGIALPEPDAGALRTAIEKVLGDKEFHRGAQRIAGEMAALPPIERAIDVLVGMKRGE